MKIIDWPEYFALNRAAWQTKKFSLSTLVQNLQRILDEGEERLGKECVRNLREVWSQLEIINALTLDGLEQVTPESVSDINLHLDEFQQILNRGYARS